MYFGHILSTFWTYYHMNKVQYHHEIMPRCQESDKITQKNLNRHWKPYQDHPVCLRKLKENLPKLWFFGVDFEILDILDLWVFVIPVGVQNILLVKKMSKYTNPYHHEKFDVKIKFVPPLVQKIWENEMDIWNKPYTAIYRVWF